MKIYEYVPIKFVRICISKQGEKSYYISLVETTKEQVMEFVKRIIEKQNISIFSTGKLTRIDIRDAEGSKNLKSTSVSFKGMTTKETYDLIVGCINKRTTNG